MQQSSVRSVFFDANSELTSESQVSSAQAGLARPQNFPNSTELSPSSLDARDYTKTAVFFNKATLDSAHEVQKLTESETAPSRPLPDEMYSSPEKLLKSYFVSNAPESRSFSCFFDTLFPFQQELVVKAHNKNSIVFLPTGAGKTVIAAALAALMLARRPTKKIVFLVNRIPLISQQAALLRKVQGAVVAEVCSERKDAYSWAELRSCSYNMVVIIDALFYDWLTKENASDEVFKDISLLIFDEIHHARKDSKYAKTLRQYADAETEDEQLPQILGLTASPGTFNDEEHTRKALTALIRLTRCHLLTVTEKTEDLAKRVSTPQTFLVEYQLSPDEKHVEDFLLEILKYLIDSVLKGTFDFEPNIRTKFVVCAKLQYGSAAYVSACRSLHTYATSIHSLGLQILVRLLTLLNIVLMLLHDSSALEALQRLESELENEEFSQCLERLSRGCHSVSRGDLDKFLFSPLYGIILQLSTFCEVYRKNLPKQELEASTKVRLLLATLDDLLKGIDLKDFRGIVFCETKATTDKIVRLISDTALGRQLHPKRFVGHNRSIVEDGDSYRTISMTDAQQQATLRSFRSGECKLLVATSVAEEGIDIPICNLVVRYEGNFSVQSFIQSRGRARKRNSKFIVVSKSDGSETLLSVFKAIEEQRRVALELQSEDQDVIINGGDSGGAALPWQRDPRHYAKLFEMEHGTQIREYVSPVCEHGKQFTLKVVVNGILFTATEVGSLKNARGAAYYSLCSQLANSSLLPTEPRRIHHSTSLTFNYIHINGNIAMTRHTPNSEVVSHYVPEEWGGTTHSAYTPTWHQPYEVLDGELRRRKLPIPKTKLSIMENGLYHSEISYGARKSDGSVHWETVEALGRFEKNALQQASIFALEQMGCYFVKVARNEVNFMDFENEGALSARDDMDSA